MTQRCKVFPSGAPEVRVAPAGGPTLWGRGCVFTLTVCAALLPATAAIASEPIAVPSGLDVSYHDIIWDTPGEGLTYRFRFLAPSIAEGEIDYMSVASDMEFLCNDFALPRLAQIGPQPNRITITLMEEPVDFGIMSPGITQYFESFSLENDLCIWEAF